MARTDWFADAEAPQVNSLVPAAAVWVEHLGKVLMIERSDSGKWSLPGGTMEYGESLEVCATREVLEETGIAVEVVGMVGVFTDSRHRIEYGDGEVRQEFAVVYRGKYLHGTPTSSPESPRVQWVPLEQLEEISMDPSQRVRVRWAVDHPEPYVGQQQLRPTASS